MKCVVCETELVPYKRKIKNDPNKEPLLGKMFTFEVDGSFCPECGLRYSFEVQEPVVYTFDKEEKRWPHC
jgi:hypothetical protein